MRTDPNRRSRSGRNRPSGRRREPLHLWRTASLDDIRHRDIERLARSLDRVELLGEPRWRAARSWDAAEAAGVALRHLSVHGAVGPGADVAMSAVLIHACGGCAASRAVVAHARRRLAPGRGHDVPTRTR
ncbi:hypothetical protein MKK88_13560 [Methylobacterium sp. E-005]|uniref:hypothetical protein n=1 Tax=Methylobacterium sp. E-005 TaxID=2836549 RepID=UPI001FB88FC0|nr:hypothetical protein [Methylobacterium sp. E-005]MCJ2087008.1 hypothetical protein [Methylobacterium sp. E-005]